MDFAVNIFKRLFLGVFNNHKKKFQFLLRFRKVASKMGIETSFVDATNAQKVAEAIKPNTRMVWVETPTNPTLKVVDIEAVAKITKKHEVCDVEFLCLFVFP